MKKKAIIVVSVLLIIIIGAVGTYFFTNSLMYRAMRLNARMLDYTHIITERW